MDHYNKYQAVAWFTEAVVSIGDPEKQERYERALEMLKFSGWTIRHGSMDRKPRPVNLELLEEPFEDIQPRHPCCRDLCQED